MITLEMLEQADACQEQVDLFRERFPEGHCQPTAELCKQFPDFDYAWAADRLLSPEKRAAYQAARAPHLAAYEAAQAPLWAAYEAAKAPHLAAYEAAQAPLWAAYEAARAETFGRIWEGTCT